MEKHIFNSRIQQIAYRKGISMNSVSRHTGINPGTMSRIFKGKSKLRNLTIGTLLTLADELKVDVNDILALPDGKRYKVVDVYGEVKHTGRACADGDIIDFPEELLTTKYKIEWEA